jgi:hypothetical protein
MITKYFKMEIACVDPVRKIKIIQVRKAHLDEKQENKKKKNRNNRLSPTRIKTKGINPA